MILGDRTTLRNGSCQVDSHQMIYLESSAGPSKDEIPLTLDLYGTACPRGWLTGTRSVGIASSMDGDLSHISSACYCAHGACDRSLEARQLHFLYIFFLPKLRSAFSFCPLKKGGLFTKKLNEDQCLCWPQSCFIKA